MPSEAVPWPYFGCAGAAGAGVAAFGAAGSAPVGAGTDGFGVAGTGIAGAGAAGAAGLEVFENCCKTELPADAAVVF